MNDRPRIHILAFVVLCAAAGASSCPYSDSAWTRLKSAQRQQLLAQISVETLDQACLEELLKRQLASPDSGAGARAAEALRSFLALHGSPDGDLLFLGLRLGLHQRAPTLWRQICRDWQHRHGLGPATTAKLREHGRVSAADSLYMALDAAGELAVNHYLDWFALRTIRRDFEGAVAVLCRLTTVQNRLDVLVRGQLSAMLADLDSTGVRRALQIYRDCYLAQPSADTAGLRLWLASTYAQMRLFADEIAAVIALESPTRPSLDYLINTARRHYVLKRYSEAIAACRAAWPRAPDEETRSLCAGIMYDSFARMGLRDSALVWLSRTNLANARSVAQAVSFYQSCGMTARADSLLRTLGPGTMRDTLQIRQFLFELKADSARTYAERCMQHPRWRMAASDAFLWRLRTALFSADMATFTRLLDSAKFEPSWEHASEVLNWKYRWARFERDEGALVSWPAFEYAMYRGDLKSAESAVVWDRCTPENAGDFLVRLVRERLARGEIAEATRLASTIDTTAGSPELIYYCAEVLYAQGRITPARALLENLLLRHPSSVYARKARILLARVQS